jgi:membrane protein implicated in regulation of membrane protease activity
MSNTSYIWIVWLIVAAIFIAAEVFTPGFFLLWFGVGALVAALMAMLGIGGLAAQLTVFLVVSVALVVASRTIFERFLVRRKSEDDVKIGVDQMIGHVGTVVESSHGALHEGAVKLLGTVWTAFPVEGEDVLTDGDTVIVERLDGNAIYVRRNPRRARPFTETSSE